jgi:hypothetical protein
MSRWTLFLWIAYLIGTLNASAQEATWRLPEGVQYATETRQEPRPLRIHRLTIELSHPSIQLAVALGPDPDGDGPVEAQLTPPKQLAESNGALALINTNAWSMFPDEETGKSPGYIAGGNADILGWAAAGENSISASQSGYWSCWMDQDRRIRISNPESEKDPLQSVHCVWAVSGFRGIVWEGRILPEPSNVRHPRSALGLFEEGMKMIWLVVDGRQPGYSEGVSEHELAQLMIDCGCDQAINLDGGGSSILLLRGSEGELRTANRPSDRTGHRPIPVALCLIPPEQSD